MNRAERLAQARQKEAEVLELRYRGVPNRIIAQRLGLSQPRTSVIYKTGIGRIAEPIAALERQRALEVIDRMLQKLWAKEQELPAARVIRYADGRVETITDNSGWVRIIESILKVEQYRSNLLNLAISEDFKEMLRKLPNDIKLELIQKWTRELETGSGLSDDTAMVVKQVLFERRGIVPVEAESHQVKDEDEIKEPSAVDVLNGALKGD